MDLLRDMSERTEEHLSGGPVYGAVPACLGRHQRVRGGWQAGGGAADRDHPDGRSDRALSAALAPWREPLAIDDPGKIMLDLAVTLALGGDCLADIAQLRGEPGVSVRSPPIRRCRGWSPPWPLMRTVHARRSGGSRCGPARAWARPGGTPRLRSRPGSPLIIDLDATLVTSHSKKEPAAPTFKRGYGFHPLCAFVDHGSAGTGEPLHLLLRPGERRMEHRDRSHRGDPSGVEATARTLPGTGPAGRSMIQVDATGPPPPS